MSEWSSLLVEARTRLDVSQAEVAALSHVSLPSVKSYERGKRHPSRPYLVAILDALKLPVMERNAIMEAAGYAPDGKDVVPSPLDLDFSAEATQAELDRLPWPAFVSNDNVLVVMYNRIIEQLWDVDIATEYPDVAERSMLSVASEPRFADRLLNWDAAVGTIASIYKGHWRGGEDMDAPSPAFASIVEKLLAGDPKYVARFATVWQEASEAPMLLRWHYPMVWDVPGVGSIDFDCVVSHCNQQEAWAFNDWIPKDAESWRVLEVLKGQG